MVPVTAVMYTQLVQIDVVNRGSVWADAAGTVRHLSARILTADAPAQQGRTDGWFVLIIGCRRQGVLVGRGRGETCGHECADAVRKNQPTSHLPPKKSLEGSRGVNRGVSAKFQSFPTFWGARQEARMREDEAEPHRRPSRQHQRWRCRQKRPHTVIYTCVLHFVQCG